MQGNDQLHDPAISRSAVEQVLGAAGLANAEDVSENNTPMMKMKPFNKKVEVLKNKDEVVAYFPVFPGTNCDYDTKSFMELPEGNASGENPLS